VSDILTNVLSNLTSNIKILNKLSSKTFWFVYCLFYDFWNLSLSNLDKSRKNLKKTNQNIYYNYNNFKFKLKIFNFFEKKNFIDYDIFWLKLMSYNYTNKKYKTNIFRSYFRVLSTKNGFYFNFKNLNKNKNLFFMLKTSFLGGLKYFWLGVRFWVFPLILCLGVVYTSLVLKLLPFNKIIFSWVVVLMFGYWLLSGFVFFFKKYQFGKYTASIQRFWRRSYILFWLIEGGTFAVFLFYTLNSSQESFYMFDQISVFKTHLYSWKFFFVKLFPVVLLILITYFLLLSVKWNLFSKHSVWLLFLTFFLTYVVWLEFYQFFHVVNFYGNLNWIYDVDDHSWSLEQEPRRTRIVNHYINLLFILKFWHIVFIYGFWLFFVLRCWETKRIRYPLLAANYQNFIILYIFTWVFMYPWFKFFFRRFLDAPYYWFYVNNRRLGFRILFNDFKLIYYGLINNFLNLNFLKNFNYSSFFYWKLSDTSNNYEIFRRHVIKERILKSLV
jgi:hypothetical protein